MTGELFIAAFGLMLLATPNLDRWLSGISADEADTIDWMMKQPLQKLFLYRFFGLSGLLLLVAAAVMP